MSSCARVTPSSLSSPTSSFPSHHHHDFSIIPFTLSSSSSSSSSSLSSKKLKSNSRLVSLCCQTPSSLSAMSNSSSSSSSSAFGFLTLCHRLKTTKRKGWLNHGIKGPESIADHMYWMALMGLIAGDIAGVNRERCIKMAIVHDIAEAIVGDITPSDGIPKEEKSRREQAALNEMCEVLGGGMRAG